jgi:hypothetical protein
MSDHEFDNYLALLAKLLRLGEAQRQAIAGELRAHLEDRLDELVSRGVPKHEAVKQALEEFGDAAALAGEFVSISRGRKRRWIMRLTTASVAAIVLIAAGIFTFWPGTNAGPGVAAVVAQNPGAAGPPGAVPPGTDRAQAVKTLDDKLNQRIDAEWIETPFRDVMHHLQDTTGITFYVKAKKIEEVGVAHDTPVSQNFKQIRLSTLLDLMLEELGLVYSQKDDLIVITTPDDASATMEVRVYDCRDLLAMPTGLPGRPGGIGPGGPDGPPGARPFLPGGPDSGTGIPFAPPGASRVPGSETPEPDAFKPQLDAPATPGTTAPPPPTRRRDDAPPRVPQRNPGDEVLPQLGGVMPGGGPGGMGGTGLGGGGFGGEYQPQRPMSAEDLKAEQLMDIVTTAVEPDSWQEMGGSGTIGQYNGLLVVSQSARTHTKVEKVLDMLRDAAGLPRTKQSRVVK